MQLATCHQDMHNIHSKADQQAKRSWCHVQCTQCAQSGKLC
jgi:hypothetical protein